MMTRSKELALALALLIAPGFAAAQDGVSFEDGGILDAPNQPLASDIGDWDEDGVTDLVVLGDEVWVYHLDGSGKATSIDEGLCDDSVVSISSMNDECIMATGPSGVCFLRRDSDGTFFQFANAVVGDSGIDNRDLIQIDSEDPVKKTIFTLDSFESAAGGGILRGYNRSPIYGENDGDDGCGGYSDGVNDPSIIELGENLVTIALGQLTGDSQHEVIVADRDLSTVWVYQAPDVFVDTDTNDWYQVDFEELNELSVADTPVALAIGDFDDDGNGDIAVASQGGTCAEGVVEVHFGDGEGGFEDATEIDVEGTPRVIGAADFNQDGIDDIVVSGSAGFALSAKVTVLIGNGTRGFRLGLVDGPIEGADAPTSLQIADFNGDDRPDIALTDSANDAVVILANTKNLDEDGGAAGCGAGGTFKRGDANGNGAVQGLQDALYILNYAFTGGDEPPCLDAADVDGNSQFSGISDAVYLLAYAFTDGSDPPSPGPTTCGADDDGDTTLDCAESGSGCG